MHEMQPQGYPVSGTLSLPSGAGRTRPHGESSAEAVRATRRVAFAAGAAAFGGAFLASCGPLQPGGEPAKKVTGKVTFFTPAGEANRAAREPQFQAFEKKNPAVKMEIIPHEGEEKLRVLFASDTPPDVFESGAIYVPTFAAKNEAKVLDPLIKRDKVDLKDFYPGVINGTSWQGKQIALTDSWATNVLFYNRDLFRRSGVPEPAKDWTYDQWLETGRRLNQPNADPPRWGMYQGTAAFSIMTLQWAWGGDWWDEQRKTCLLNAPESVAALEWILNLWNKHQLSPAPSYTSQPGQGYLPLFRSGRLATYHFGGLWEADGHLKTPELDWAVVPLPKGPKGRAGYGFMAIYAIAANAKNADGGWEWLKFMTGPEGYESKGADLQATPARKSLAAHPRAKTIPWLLERGALASQVESFPNVRLPRYVPEFGEIQKEVMAAMGKIWNGQASPKGAMDEVAPRVTAMLAQAMK